MYSAVYSPGKHFRVTRGLTQCSSAIGSGHASGSKLTNREFLVKVMFFPTYYGSPTKPVIALLFSRANIAVRVSAELWVCGCCARNMQRVTPTCSNANFGLRIWERQAEVCLICHPSATFIMQTSARVHLSIRLDARMKHL